MFYDQVNSLNREQSLPHHDMTREATWLVPLVNRGHWDTFGPRIPTYNTQLTSLGPPMGLPASEAPESLENNESYVEVTEPSLDWRPMT